MPTCRRCPETGATPTRMKQVRRHPDGEEVEVGVAEILEGRVAEGVPAESPCTSFSGWRFSLTQDFVLNDVAASEREGQTRLRVQSRILWLELCRFCLEARMSQS